MSLTKPVNIAFLIAVAYSSMSLAESSKSYKDPTEANVSTLLKDVPESVVERQKELKKYEHLAAVLSEMKKIEESKAGIVKAQKGGDEAPKAIPQHQIDFGPSMIEQQLNQAMQAAATSSKQVDKETSKKEASEFKGSIALISLWGNPKNPTADVLINNRPAEVRRNSTINGWRVLEVNSEFVKVSRKQTVKQIYYSNATGN